MENKQMLFKGIIAVAVVAILLIVVISFFRTEPKLGPTCGISGYPPCIQETYSLKSINDMIKSMNNTINYLNSTVANLTITIGQMNNTIISMNSSINSVTRVLNITQGVNLTSTSTITPMINCGGGYRNCTSINGGLYCGAYGNCTKIGTSLYYNCAGYNNCTRIN